MHKPNRLNRLLAGLLALCVCVGVSATALAAEEDPAGGPQAGESPVYADLADTEPIVSLTKDQRAQGTVILQAGNYAAAVNAYLYHIYPGEKDVVPYLDASGVVMVPLRFAAEKLGIEVTWDEAAQSVLLTQADQRVVLKLNEPTYFKSGAACTMQAAPALLHDRTMVPLSFFAQALDLAVYWGEQNQLIVICPAEEPWQPDRQAEQELTSDVLLITSPLIRDLIQ